VFSDSTPEEQVVVFIEHAYSRITSRSWRTCCGCRALRPRLLSTTLLNSDP